MTSGACGSFIHYIVTFLHKICLTFSAKVIEKSCEKWGSEKVLSIIGTRYSTPKHHTYIVPENAFVGIFELEKR